MDSQAATQVADATIKATPPVLVTGSTILGYTPAEWVCFATFIYTVLQAHFLLRKNCKTYRNILKAITRRV